jgi:hypothetical protein
MEEIPQFSKVGRPKGGEALISYWQKQIRVGWGIYELCEKFANSDLPY